MNDRKLWNGGWHESEYGMLECCISGGCAGLGNLYILTVVVVMIDDSNTQDDIRVDYGFQSVL